MKIFICNPPWKVERGYGVRAGSRWAHTIEEKGRVKYFPFPFWLAYSAAFLEKKGEDVILKDYLAQEEGKRKFFKDVKKFNPELLVMETSTPSFENDILLARKLKEDFGIPICLAGTHVTAMPEEVLSSPYVDYVLIGEYEYTLTQLIEGLKNGRKLRKTKGLGFKRDKKMFINKQRNLIKNLDELPFPARHFLPMDKYNDLFCKYYPSIPLISSRGCPFRCSFCLERVFFGKPIFRSRSPKNVVDEIEEIIENYKVGEIYFDDATFSIGEKRVLEICDEIIKRRINIPWSCMGHASVSRKLLEKMKKAGCRAIKIGVETADPRILKNINKSVSLGMVRKCVKNCKEIGLDVHATYMIGLPGETKSTIKRTLKFAFSLGTTTCQFSLATPFPGTGFYEYVSRNGFLRAKSWREFDGNKYVVVEYPNLSREEILKAFLYCKRKYFLHKLKDINFISNVFVNTLKEYGLGIIPLFIRENVRELLKSIWVRF